MSGETPTVRCKHCLCTTKDHAELKCLYAPTRFEALQCHACCFVLRSYHAVYRNGENLPLVCASCAQPSLWTLVSPAAYV